MIGTKPSWSVDPGAHLGARMTINFLSAFEDRKQISKPVLTRIGCEEEI